MKIALVRQRVTALGGAETTLHYLVRGLAAAGHDVRVYAAESEAAARAALGPEIGYVRVPVWGGKTLRLLSFALNSHRLIQAARPRMVFSLERVPAPLVYRAGDGCHREWLARRARYLSPAARIAQSLSPFHRVMLFLERLLFSYPDLRRVIANSQMVKEEIIRHYGVDPARIRVIVNGLDHQRFKPLTPDAREELRRRLGAPPPGEVVLFVGSGFKRKGLTYLLQAFGSLNDQTSHLWVVGKGREAPCRRLAARLGLGDRVRFWGPVNETAPFYQAATLLALPTLYDPCSNVVLEAMACGTPVITSAANGAAEFIRPGANGAIIAQPGDLAALRQALAAFLDSGRDPAARRAAAAAVAHLNWESTLAQTLEVLEDANLGNRG